MNIDETRKYYQRKGEELPKQAQEGLEKLGEKIGDSEWDDIFRAAWNDMYVSGRDLTDWLREHYSPPKLKKK